MKKSTVLLVMLVVCLSYCHSLWAQSLGTGFTYQGKLNDGGLAANGLYDFEFEVFDDPNFIMGTPVGLPVFKEDVSVYDGHFTVTLDFGFGVFDGDGRWLEIRVRQGAIVGGYTTLQPRQTVTPAPYALYAVSSGSGSGGDADTDPTNELQTLGLVGSTLSISSGNSLILPTGGGGVTVPLDLSGAVATPGAAISGTNTGSGYGLYGKHNSSNNWGLVGSSAYGVAGRDESSGNYGWLGSNNEGVYGFSSSGYAGRFGGDVLVEGSYYDSSTDAGIAGQVLASTGSGTDWIDVIGSGGVTVPLELSGSVAFPDAVLSGSNTGSGLGIYGSSVTGPAVFGENFYNGNYGYFGGNYGVYGNSNNADGIGVYGSSKHGQAVHGQTTDGYAIYGYNITTSNYAYLAGSIHSVYGEHSNSGNYGYLGSSSFGVLGSSDNGRGVYGTSINSYGVYGNSSSGYGVYGNTSTGTAVRGTHTGTGNYGYFGSDTYGVYGSSSGYAGYFDGDLYAQGNVAIATTTPNANTRLHVESHDYHAGYFTADRESINTAVIFAEYTGNNSDSTAIYGISNPADGLGYGGNFLGGNTGVKGSVVATGNKTYRGVEGRASGGSGKNYGVSGYAGGSGTNYAISGEANGSGTNFAGYFLGDVVIPTGGFGVGTLAPDYEIHVLGSIAYTGGIWDISDIRLKENIMPLTGGIEKISSLKGIYFNNKDESSSNREVGVIAQDVEKVLPELVSTDQQGFKSVDYSKLSPVLIEAVKELKAENDLLKQKLEAMEMNMKTIMTKIDGGLK